MANEEIWKPISGYEGLYEISDIGRVKSLPNGQHKESIIMRQKTDKDGYKYLGLTRDHYQRFHRINRLILIAFVGDPPFFSAQGNHKNGIKSDNRLENLEWETNSGNQLHSYRVLGNKAASGEGHGHTKTTPEQVIDMLWMIAGGASQSLAAAQYGLTQTTASAIWHGKCWKYLEIPYDLRVKMAQKGSRRG